MGRGGGRFDVSIQILRTRRLRFAVCLFLLKGMRANKHRVMKTLAEIKGLTDKALDAIKKLAVGIAAGTAAPTTSGKKRKGCALQTPNKRGKQEVDEDDIESPNKKSALSTLSLPYMLWGNSQKVKLAGVSGSVGCVNMVFLFITAANTSETLRVAYCHRFCGAALFFGHHSLSFGPGVFKSVGTSKIPGRRSNSHVTKCLSDLAAAS